MVVRLKLYALLGKYLPAGAENNEADLELPDGATPEAAMAAIPMPPELAHLVLVNGIYVAPSERGSLVLKDGDALAMWPPVAGG
jgi:molybdopterin synthase sulfur carrier subunit